MPNENCEIRWCKSGQLGTVRVVENIGDGAYSVWICKQCANDIGVRAEQDLPSPARVGTILRAAERTRHMMEDET